MRTCIVFNPNAGTAAKVEALRAGLEGRRGFVLRETERAGHARELAAEAAAQGYDRVVAAGGDGTISEVVNGLADGGLGPALGIVPLGTGNDFARTLGIEADPTAAIAALDADRRRKLDLISVTTAGEVRWGINVATGGFSGQVDEAVTDEMKQTWGPLAYVRGAAAVLPDLTGYTTLVQYDDGEEELVDAFNIVVANGRACGAGMNVCPCSNPEDGLLDVVILHQGSVGQLAAVGMRLVTGNWLEHELVTHRTSRRVKITSRPGMWFNVDGELVSNQPILFECIPSAIEVVVGPAYRRDPA